jgi:hypothetical protein
MTAPQLPIRILRDRSALAIGLGWAVLPVPALAGTLLYTMGTKLHYMTFAMAAKNLP